MASKFPVPESFPVQKTEQEWKAELSAEDFRVLRNKVKNFQPSSVPTNCIRQQHPVYRQYACTVSFLQESQVAGLICSVLKLVC